VEEPVTLYLDCDGVLADFDREFAFRFGSTPADYEASHGAAAFWDLVATRPQFYRWLPSTSDGYQLWLATEHLRPVILTGAPRSLPTAEEDKRGWIGDYFGADAAARAIVTLARTKHEHCKSGDVLVDDRPKYRDLWESAGGIWVTHTSAERSIAELRRLGVLDEHTGTT
jgi:hypothetical protein